MRRNQPSNRRNRKSSEAHEHSDVFHNTDLPCCRILHDSCQDIFFFDESVPKAERPALTKILYERWLLERQQAQQQAQTASPTAKKKRKKKKKKKSSSGEGETTVASAVESKPSGETEAAAASVTPPPVEPQTTPPTVNPSLSSDDLGGVETSKQQQQQQQDSTLFDLSPLQRRELNRFVDRVLAKQIVDENSNTSMWKDQLPEFLKFLSQSPNPGDYHISNDSIERAVKAIQCGACRRQVEHILSVESTIPLQAPQPPQQHVTDSWMTDDTHAFDYVAMEEGNAVPEEDRSLHFQLVATGESAGWQLRCANGEPVEWTSVAHLDAFLTQHVVLAGLSPDVVTDASQLSDNVLRSICETVSSRYHTYEEQLTSIGDRLSEAMQKVYDSRDRGQTGNIEMKTFPVLQNVDQTIGSLLAELLRILVEITHSFFSVLASVPKDSLCDFDWAWRVVDECWEVYCKAIDSFHDGVLHFEKQLFDMALEQGQLVGMFLSQTQREVYRKLVEYKGDELMAMQAVLHGCLTRSRSWECLGAEPNWSAHFLKKLLAYEAFFKVVATSEEGKHARTQPMDIACEDVLYTVRDWTETVFQVSVRKILEGQEESRRKFQRLFDKAESYLFEATQAISQNDVTVAERIVSLQQDMATLHESIEAVDDEEESLKTLRSQLGTLTGKMVRFWLTVRMNQKIDGEERQLAPVMPYKLQRWMAAPSERYSDHQIDYQCLGAEGTDRAVGILVGLYFRWLSSRCNEWHAVLAEQELLTAMEDDEIKALDGSANGKTKPGKKAKKKSKKAAVATEKNELMTTVDMKPTNGQESATANGDVLLGKEDRAETHAGDGTSGQETKEETIQTTAPLSTEEDIEVEGSTKPSHVSDSAVEATAISIPAPATPSTGASIDVTDDLSNVVKETKKAPEKEEQKTATNDLSGNATTGTSYSQPKRTERDKSGAPPQDRKEKATPAVVSPGISSAGKGKKGKGPVEPTKQHSEKRSPRVLQDIDAAVSVGVYDKSGDFQSAEAFLVGRLVAVVGSSKSSTEKPKPRWG